MTARETPNQLDRLPRLVIVGESVVGYPVRGDKLNYRSYAAVLASCDRIDVIGSSPLAAGHEEVDGALAVHGLPRRDGWLGHLRFVWQACRLVRTLHRTVQPDIYWLSDPLCPGLVGWYAARRYHTAVVCQVQGDYLRVSKSRFGLAKRWLMRRMLRWVASWSDRVRVVSRRLADDLVALGVPRGRVVAIPSRVKLSLFSRAEHAGTRVSRRAEWGWSDRRVLIFVGSFNDSKGLDMLLDAAAQVAAECPDLRYALVGSGAQLPELQAQAKALGIEHLLCFPGRVAHDQVPAWLAAADGMILSSRDEGLPRAALEAAAMELPLVITRVGGNAETVIDGVTGWLVEPTASSIASGLRAFAAVSAADCATMGQAAREHVEREFDFGPNIAVMTRELLHRVLADRR